MIESKLAMQKRTYGEPFSGQNSPTAGCWAAELSCVRSPWCVQGPKVELGVTALALAKVIGLGGFPTPMWH